MAKYVRTFNELNKGDAEIAGGKGASLGEMTRLFGGQAHLHGGQAQTNPVPPGFVILADAFRVFVEESGIKVDIESILSSVNIHNTNSVEVASEKIRAMFATIEISREIVEKILKSFEKLDAKFVAVRSSATAEDSSSASWAGELESYLYTTKSTLLENIKKCWSSLFTPRAIFYRVEKGMGADDVAVAVVVQKMIASEVSGVCFTVHPVTKDYNQLIIEAAWGLGEAIVGGLITPDSYVIDKKENVIINTYVSEQTKKIVKKSEGGTKEVEVDQKNQERQKLSNLHILELAKLAQKIEARYGSPQDIEWALTNEKLWILQSRPITTL